MGYALNVMKLAVSVALMVPLAIEVTVWLQHNRHHRRRYGLLPSGRPLPRRDIADATGMRLHSPPGGRRFRGRPAFRCSC